MPCRRLTATLAMVLATLLASAGPATATEAKIAVAANFAGPARDIADAFSQATGHRLTLVTGSTGKLYAQIANGAPFDALLAADDETPARLAQAGLAVADTRFAYATGRLVLWSAQPGVVDGDGAILREGGFRHLAVANPKLAPYGRAAMEALAALGLDTRLAPRFVLGENIAQTHQFAASGNAELGFVALSQVARDGRLTGGSGWIVPAQLHRPIRQEAVLLAHGRDNSAARAFLDWLRGSPAAAAIRRFGYDLP